MLTYYEIKNVIAVTAVLNTLIGVFGVLSITQSPWYVIGVIAGWCADKRHNDNLKRLCLMCPGYRVPSPVEVEAIAPSLD